MNDQMGGYAFMAGVLLALIAGVFTSVVSAWSGIIALVLVLLGLVVGFLNVSDKETEKFLISAIALLLVSSVSGLATIDQFLPSLGSILERILANIAFFVTPAALIVALKSVMSLAKN